MKIKYEFLTGEFVEIEVPEAIGEVAIAIDKEIYNSNRRETCKHNSVEKMQEQGIHIADESVDVVSIVEQQEKNEVLYNALDKLLPQQLELIQKVFFEGKTMADIAREEGVSAKAIQNRINKIKTQLKKEIEKKLL